MPSKKRRLWKKGGSSYGKIYPINPFFHDVMLMPKKQTYTRPGKPKVDDLLAHRGSTTLAGIGLLGLGLGDTLGEKGDVFVLENC